MAKTPLTLRELCALVGEEFMDAPLMIQVRDGNLNIEDVDGPGDIWELPRVSACGDTNEPASLALRVYLKRHRLVTRSKR